MRSSFSLKYFALMKVTDRLGRVNRNSPLKEGRQYRRYEPLVVFQKWRWTEMNVTLGLIFVALLRKEWPMMFIAVRCPHCQSDQIVKRSKTARGGSCPSSVRVNTRELAGDFHKGKKS
jgi:hypothetical protein